MHDRLQRYVIPATVVLMSAILTVWLGGVPTSNQMPDSSFFNGGDTDMLAFVIAVGVTNFGLGYISHALFLALMFLSQKERLIAPDRLLCAFQVQVKSQGNKTRRRHRNSLLGEFHFRFHSRAGKNIVDHCTRRNSAWYIAKTSGIAAVLGWLTGIIFIFKSPHYTSISLGWFLGWSIIILIFFIMSSLVGTQWNREFWDVAWKWIADDVSKNPLSEEFLNSNDLKKREQSGAQPSAPADG